MTQANGERVVKVGKKGHILFEFEGKDASVVLRVDVIALYDEWVVMDRQFRDEEGKVPTERIQEMEKAIWNWVRDVIGRSVGETAQQPERDRAKKVINGLSLANALEFRALLIDEANALFPFFKPKSAEKPSSAESTELRFST